MSVHMPKFDHEAYYDQFDAVGAMELQQTPEHPTSAPLSQEARVPPTCLPQFHLPTRTRRLLLPLPPLAVESSLVLHQVLSLSPTLPLSLSPSLSPSLLLSLARSHSLPRPSLASSSSSGLRSLLPVQAPLVTNANCAHPIHDISLFSFSNLSIISLHSAW